MNTSRGAFSSKAGFIIAAAGSAVGLGNIWGFPIQTAKSGGAAFLLIYLVLVFVICVPVMISEIAIGRNTAKNPVGAINAIAPGPWRYVGGLGVLCGVMILSFYIVIAGWVLGYFLETVTGNLDRLASDGEFGNFVGSAWKNLAYTGMFMLATIGIVVGGIKDGIEKWSKYLMPTLVGILFLLIIYVLTLENAAKGVAFYLVPDFSKITVGTVNAALSQAFFSLSLGMGALITYGSYVSKKDNIVSSAFLVAGADAFIAFSAGLLVIPAVFTLAPETTAATIQAGPGLIFEFIPRVFMNIATDVGYGFASVLAAVFFMLICFAALTSTISLLEVPTSYVVDEHGIGRKRAAIIMGLIIFFVSLFSLLANGAVEFLSVDFITYPSGAGQSFFTLIADLFYETLLPLGGFFLVVFAAYRWKTARFSAEISEGFATYKGSLHEKFVTVMIMFVCPLVIIFIFVFTVMQKFFNITLF